MSVDEQSFEAPNQDNSKGAEVTREQIMKKYDIPAEGDRELGRFIYNKFMIAKKEKDRLEFHAKWLKNYELFRGRHFKTPVKKWPLVPVNVHWMIVSRTKAHLTDNKPRFEITAHDELSEPMVDIMNPAAAFWWKTTMQQVNLSDTIHNSELYGTTIEKYPFNPTMAKGRGDMETLVVDPFKFFPWPGIRNLQKMPFLFEIDILDVETIARDYPEKGHLVRPDKQWSGLIGKEREEIKAGSLTQNMHADNLPNNYAASGGHTTENINRAMAIECWCHDYTMEPVYEDQPILVADENPESDTYGQELDSGETQRIQVGEKPKYPGYIRKITIANEGALVLDDEANPSINPNLPEEVTMETWLYDRYPYEKCDSNTDTSNFWAFSAMEQIEILSKEINKKISQIAANIDKTVRPPLIIPKNIGLEDGEISNLPGQKWWVTNPIMSQYIRYMAVPNLPSDFFKYLELLLKLVDVLTGINEVTEGRKPKGVSAASAIVALQEKAQTMFREKIRNLDLLIVARGRAWISHVQNWYTEARKLKLSGKTAEKFGNYTEYRGTEMQGDMSFDVVPGSTLPKSMWVRRDQSLQLFNAGAIDQEAILEEFDYPKRDEIIRRMQLGIIGEIAQKAEAVGFPPEIIQAFVNLASMDDNQIKQYAAAQGEAGGPLPKSGGSSQPAPKTQPGGKK